MGLDDRNSVMKVLLVGASGYLGSHLLPQLLGAEHDVVGVVRKDSDAQSVRAQGAQVLKSDLLDGLDTILETIHRVDAVVFAAQLQISEEYNCLDAIIEEMSGTEKTLIMTSGTGVLSQRTDGLWVEDAFSEEDNFTPSKYVGGRKRNEQLVLQAASRGVRGIVIRPPLIWGNGKSPAVADLFRSVAITGSACYVGNGLNVYSNVHVDDLCDIYLRALIHGRSGDLFHAVSGETNFRSLAEAISGRLGVPAKSVTLGEAIEIWGKFKSLVMFSSCSRSKSPKTREVLGWAPNPERVDIFDEITHPEMVALANTL